MSEKIEIEKFLGLAKPVIPLERGQLVALHQTEYPEEGAMKLDIESGAEG
ncbi:hypothetical protein LF371_002345 [Acinetobacter baumannii]|nr:hypothetical protein [Acinetobacter baumannii]EKV0088563.1 hypothetical protein [Acinetobacter baumannii]EKV0091496.1 hypothetical protein [Acinetobacter baumannii]EKV0100934.1 hypothetical protein [Acinetobacter baumannii]EKV0180779.1 hypothetical protein [Acinetobacter baumannii]